MTEKEKKERQEELEQKKIEKEVAKFINNYIEENFDKIQYNDIHLTELKYAYEKGKKAFKKAFEDMYGGIMFLEILTKKKITFPLKATTTCWNCGQFIKLTIDENHVISSTTEECFNEKVFSFDIKVPSGKILFCDWPHLGSEILKIEDENVNYLYGRYLQSKNFAEKFVMHYYVGNTSPTISQKGNEIIIEDEGYDNETDDELYYGNGFEPKGHIYTDLWWVTGIDLEYYRRLLVKEFGENILNDEEVKEFIEDAVILDVEPGIYKCTTFYETCDRDDRSKSQIFVKIEKN